MAGLTWYEEAVTTTNSTNEPEDKRPVIRRKGNLSTKRPKVQVTTSGYGMITFKLNDSAHWGPPAKEVCLIYPSNEDTYNSASERITIHECKYHWVVVTWQ